MAPIKSKKKEVVKAFRQGKLAEPRIHDNVIPFIDGGDEMEVGVVVLAVEQGIIDGGNGGDATVTTTTPVKRAYPDKRRWCFRCTYKAHVEVDGRRKPKNLSRFPGGKPKKTKMYCMRCDVALCNECFRPWHEEEVLPASEPEAGFV
jgi:hypothetical protein